MVRHSFFVFTSQEFNSLLSFFFVVEDSVAEERDKVLRDLIDRPWREHTEEEQQEITVAEKNFIFGQLGSYCKSVLFSLLSLLCSALSLHHALTLFCCKSLHNAGLWGAIRPDSSIHRTPLQDKFSY